MRLPIPTARRYYVAAWCRLNHLKCLIMPEYPKLTMAELEAAWIKLTAAQDAEHARALLAAIETNARTYASKPPHAATYGLHH